MELSRPRNCISKSRTAVPFGDKLTLILNMFSPQPEGSSKRGERLQFLFVVYLYRGVSAVPSEAAALTRCQGLQDAFLACRQGESPPRVLGRDETSLSSGAGEQESPRLLGLGLLNSSTAVCRGKILRYRKILSDVSSVGTRATAILRTFPPNLPSTVLPSSCATDPSLLRMNCSDHSARE